MKTKITIMAMALAVFGLAQESALAGWYYGPVTNLSVGYEGNTVTFKLQGWERIDCTCYATWASHMCLDSDRKEFDFEKAMLLTARVSNMTMAVRIDEETCRVRAMHTIE